jgi:AraC family transcriptional activator of pobA
MRTPIPTFPLSILSQPGAAASELLLVNQPIEATTTAIQAPYRSTYYGVGICLAGTAELRSNLETYAVAAGWMVTMSPHTIKQWLHRSADFTTLSVFFTNELAQTAALRVDQYAFFDPTARHAFPVSPAQQQQVEATLHFLQVKHAGSPAGHSTIVPHVLRVLLSETEAIYAQQQVTPTNQTRAQWLAAEFKKLVQHHCVAERALTFYARHLCVTASHLSESVKEVTGRTAGEWLTEAVALEAKVLLQNPSLSVAQVADSLHFVDQSTFGKFFKQATGFSPSQYRRPAERDDSGILTNSPA